MSEGHAEHRAHPQEAMNSLMCLMSACSFSYCFCWMISFSFTVLTKVS